MPPFVSGTRSTFDNNGSTVIAEIQDGLDFLNPRRDGIEILRRLGVNGFTFSNHKYSWRETAIAPRKQTVTIAGLSTDTTLTVLDSNAFIADALVKVENEVMRITSGSRTVPHPSATTVTVVRGYGGSTVAAHTAKPMINLGTAKPEGADASQGVTDNGIELYNYDQIFERGVALTAHEIAALSVEGNPLPKQLSRRQIEIWQELANAMFYGRRIQDTTNEIYALGGLKQFVTTNVTNAGALDNTVDMIDEVILAIVIAGGNPTTLSVSPRRKQKLDKIDVNKIQISKSETRGGGLDTHTWRSGVLDHDLDIIVDHGIMDDEIHINDWDHVEFGHLSNNGINGAFHVVDATPNGANRKEQVIRGTFGMRLKLEKGQGYIYNLA